MRRRLVTAILASSALFVAACGSPTTGTLDDTGDLAHDAAARAAADDVVADALGTRLSVLGPVCEAVADRVGGSSTWAGLHCSIDTDPRWAVGMIDEGDDPDPFRRTLATLDDEIAVEGIGDEAWFDPDDGTLYVSDDRRAFFFTLPGATRDDIAAMRDVALASLP